LPQSFDATLKYLVAFHPSDWLEIAGLPSDGAQMLEEAEEQELLSADLSTVTAAADILMRLQGGGLAHIEFQTGADPRMDARTLRYNVLADYRYEQPVESVVILLRREADHSAITGGVRRVGRGGAAYLDFRYRIVRVWQIPVRQVLAGPLGVLPIAPLADLQEASLPEVIRQMDARIRQEAASAEAEEIWTSVFVLMGIKYSAEQAQGLLRGVMGMEESTTYQFILKQGEARGKAEGEAEGEARGIREMIMRIGTKRFGDPAPDVHAALDGIAAAAPLREIADRLLEVESWQELLDQG
jgi:predicted transposase YdaD